MFAFLAMLGLFAAAAARKGSLGPSSSFWTEDRGGVLHVVASRVNDTLAAMAAKLVTQLTRDAESSIVQLGDVGPVADGVTTRPALEWVQAATQQGFTVLVHLSAPLLAAVRPEAASAWAAVYQPNGFWVQGGEVQSGVQWAVLLAAAAGVAPASGDPMLPKAQPAATVGADDAERHGSAAPGFDDRALVAQGFGAAQPLEWRV